MSNYIVSQRGRISQRHYTLLANQAGHWFNVSPSRLEEYIHRHGDDFCVVLFRDGPDDDYYVLPYSAIKPLLEPDSLMPSGINTERWVGSIRNGMLDIRRTDRTLNVERYHNAFDLL